MTAPKAREVSKPEPFCVGVGDSTVLLAKGPVIWLEIEVDSKDLRDKVEWDLQHIANRLNGEETPAPVPLISDANDKAKAEERVKELEALLANAEEDVMGDACQFARETGTQIADLEAEAERLRGELERVNENWASAQRTLRRIRKELSLGAGLSVFEAIRALVDRAEEAELVARKRAAILDAIVERIGGRWNQLPDKVAGMLADIRWARQMFGSLAETLGTSSASARCAAGGMNAAADRATPTEAERVTEQEGG